MEERTIAQYIDHTILKADCQEAQIIELCREAKEYGFAAVCVNPYFVNLASKLLAGTKVKIATVIGFPLGANVTNVKEFEAMEAFKAGAHEVDMVINIGALKDKRDEFVKEDIVRIVEIAKGQVPKKTVKVIIETSLLTEEEKVRACKIILETGAHFIKTSTGFSTGGATLEDIRLIKSIAQNKVAIKASGGVKDYMTAKAMIEAGADRIGTSSGKIIVGANK